MRPWHRGNRRQLLAEPHLGLVVEVGPRHVEELLRLIDDGLDDIIDMRYHTTAHAKIAGTAVTNNRHLARIIGVNRAHYAANCGRTNIQADKRSIVICIVHMP